MNLQLSSNYCSNYIRSFELIAIKNALKDNKSKRALNSYLKEQAFLNWIDLRKSERKKMELAKKTRLYKTNEQQKKLKEYHVKPKEK